MDLLVNKKRKNTKIGGKVYVSGAKNSALAIIPAALLSSEEVTLNNVPNISDIKILLSIIKDQNHFISYNENLKQLKIKRNKKAKWVFDDEVKRIRGSYYFIGAYLGYFKKIAIKSSGGCDLGSRPTNFHHDAFLALGAKYKKQNEFDIYKCRHLKGTEINLEFPSVGATINIIISSVLAKKTTTITNYALEPEVHDVIKFLNSMGANIKGFNEDRLVITGVKRLTSTTYSIMPDRIEAGTYLALGCLHGEVSVIGLDPTILENYLTVLESIGHKVTRGSDFITCTKGEKLYPVDIKTAPHPQFPTDLGPIIAVLLTQIEGNSSVLETIFQNRFSYVDELVKMGAKITKLNNTITITGVTEFKGASVVCSDLRCSAALVLASTLANETMVIKNIDHLLRGYEDCFNKLRSLKIKCYELE